MRSLLLPLLIMMGAPTSAAGQTPDLAAPASPQISPLVAAQEPETTLPPRYIASLAALEDAMESDSLLHPRAQAYSRKLATAAGVAFGGINLGAAMLLVGTVTGERCSFEASASSSCTPSPNVPLMVGGLLLAFSSVVASWVIGPSPGEMIDLVNDWNARHPNRPVAVVPPLAPGSHRH